MKSDRLVINGQKVWTSYARFAEWCILVARTNPGVAKHRGLTFVVVDMRTPGIRIRPLVEMTGVAWFNEVFFEDVEVPLDMVIGRIDHGWDIAITTLSHERGTVVPYQRLRQHLDALVALAGRVAERLPMATRVLVRQRLAQLCIDVEVLRLSTYRSVSGIMRAGRPGPEGSMLKVLWSELEQRIMEAAGWLSGTHAALDEHAPEVRCRTLAVRRLWSRGDDLRRHLRGAAQHHRAARSGACRAHEPAVRRAPTILRESDCPADGSVIHGGRHVGRNPRSATGR